MSSTKPSNCPHLGGEVATRLKRKATQSALEPKNKRIKTEEKPFRFLELPGELRNLVYEQVAQQQAGVLHRGKLLVHSGLLGVSKQVGGECRAVVLIAGDIQANVNNFDFRHVVTFINKLYEAELTTLLSITTVSRRAIKINLNFTRYLLEGRSDQKLLHRWLNRTGHTTKKEAKLDMVYAGSYVYRQDQVVDAHRMVERYARENAYNERTAEEANRIKVALKFVLDTYERL